MEPRPPLSLPQGDWRQQMQAMAVTIVDPARQQRAARQSSSLVKRQIAGMVVLTIAILAGMGLYLSGVDDAIDLSDTGASIPIVLIPVVAMAVIGARILVPSNLRRAVEASDDWLAPLGLRTTSLPISTIVHDASGHSRHRQEGPTVVSGRRYGRDVEITFDVKSCVTAVGGTYPGFTVTSTGSGLATPEGAPPQVHDIIGSLKGERWNRVAVAGGPKGIRVRRKVRGSQAKEGLWLSDLWLAERLADELGRG